MHFHPFRWSIAEGVMDSIALSSKDYAAASFLDRRALSVTSSDHYFSMPIAKMHQPVPKNTQTI